MVTKIQQTKIHYKCQRLICFYLGGLAEDDAAENDQSQIFDIRPKPKTSILKIRPSAEGLSRSYGKQNWHCGIDRTLSYSASSVYRNTS